MRKPSLFSSTDADKNPGFAGVFIEAELPVILQEPTIPPSLRVITTVASRGMDVSLSGC